MIYDDLDSNYNDYVPEHNHKLLQGISIINPIVALNEAS
jgi:hypothetical protein